MKHFLLIFLLCTTLIQAKGFTSLQLGVSWPQTLEAVEEESDKIFYDFGFHWGGVSDRKISFLGRLHLTGKGTRELVTLSQETDSKSGTFHTYKETNSLRRKVAALGLGIVVNPLDSSFIRPLFKLSYAPTLMVLVNDDDEFLNDTEVIPPTGLYRGSTKNIELEIHTMVSERASLFISGGYQFGYLKKRMNYSFFEDEREYIEQSTDGITLRAGIMFW